MSLERKLEIIVLKAYWEEIFDLRMEAAEVHVSKTAAGAERLRAQADLIKHGIEMARLEIKIRQLEKAS